MKAVATQPIHYDGKTIRSGTALPDDWSDELKTSLVESGAAEVKTDEPPAKPKPAADLPDGGGPAAA